MKKVLVTGGFGLELTKSTVSKLDQIIENTKALTDEPEPYVMSNIRNNQMPFISKRSRKGHERPYRFHR